MTTTEPDITPDVPEAHEPSNRRSLLGKGAIAAAAAATGALVVGKTASAANGDPLNIGAANTGTATTGLGGGSSLAVTNGTSATSVANTAVSTSVLGVTDAAPGAGVVGSASGTGAYGVWGEHTGTNAGAGVIGASASGPGVEAIGSTGSADVLANGTGAVLLNKPLFTTTPPTTTVVGTIARGPDGTLYYSAVAGQWVTLASATSAGTFHVITPARVYDSRLPIPSPNGKLATGQNRVVSVKDARNETSGVVTTADVVPAGATAVVINLTVTETEGDLGGFLSVVPGDATTRSGSSINWSGPNQNIANGLTAKIAADRTVKVFCGGIPTPATHFVIDVTGYWM